MHTLLYSNFFQIICLMDLFKSSLLGPNQSHKAMRNVKQRTYVKKFLLFMLGHEGDINRTLCFLANASKLNGFVAFICPLLIQTNICIIHLECSSIQLFGHQLPEGSEWQIETHQPKTRDYGH